MTLFDGMKKGATLLFALCLMFMTPVNAMQAKITEIPEGQSEGKIAIKQTEDSEFIKAKVDDVIQENGVIVTGKGDGSQVELEIDDALSKALVRLGSNSYLKLNTSSKQLQLLLEEGEVLVQNVDNLNLNVYVGNFVAASEGTTFSVGLSDLVEVDDENDELNVNVEVYEGKVKFLKQGDEEDKAEFILPGEKANFKLRFKRFLEQRQARIANIQNLKQTGMFSEARLARLNQFINATREKNLQLRDQRINNFQLNMDKPLFQNFKKRLAQRNLERINQNKLLQLRGELQARNIERRQKLIEQIKENRIQRQQQFKENQMKQKEKAKELQEKRIQQHKDNQAKLKDKAKEKQTQRQQQWQENQAKQRQSVKEKRAQRIQQHKDNRAKLKQKAEDIRKKRKAIIEKNRQNRQNMINKTP